MTGLTTPRAWRDENRSLFPGGMEYVDVSGTGQGPWIPAYCLVDPSTPTNVLAINSNGSLNVSGGFTAAVVLPAAATPGSIVSGMADKFGRQVVLPVTIRDLVGTQTTTISASTAETTIVTAGAAGVLNDLMMLIISNTSTSTSTRIDFRDATSGTILFSLQSVGGGAPVGFALGGVPIPQTTAANNWTAQCGTSTTDIRIYAVYVKNK